MSSSSSSSSPSPDNKPSPPTLNISLPSPTRPTLPSLMTPKSAGIFLPSELPRSPLAGPVADLIKHEDDLKTPITPPLAYTDFLKALCPALSPLTSSPSTSRSTTSNFSDRSGKLTPLSQPSSAGSSCSSCHCDGRKASAASAPLIPPSPFVRPPLSRNSSSGRTPTALRRLRIPQSPVFSPTTDSPKSGVLRSPFSPADWVLDGKTRYYGSPRSSGHRPVSVKQVVTRTVTYTRTPLEPAPKGKRRKLE